MTTSINSILENNGNKDDLIALFFDKNLPVDDIEDDLVYTLLKSSDIVNDVTTARKKVIITQNFVNQDTEYIKYCYPKTWKYLIDHIDYFLKRKSSVYKNKPLFSIFSIGEYSFLPYKIAISSLYKKICFQLIMPDDNKPVMVDDTCNYISFETETEARFVYSLLISKTVEVYL
ncbi:MAG: hypothetical protein FWG20_05970, partial [Candidatus Cloacimonetes bacterium]|nr:hypothetical protein [Candidatus Cloacimonadota bacterium]